MSAPELSTRAKAEARTVQENYAAWLRARAALETADLTQLDPGTPPEAELNRLMDDVDRTARAMMTTPTRSACGIFKKLAVLEHAMTGDEEDIVEWDDRRLVWMLACVKADLMALASRLELE